MQFRRPPESQLPSLMGGVTVEHVVSLAVGWKGVTPSKLLGPAGGSDELEFDRELWGEWVRDHVDHVSQCATEIARRITEHLEKRAASGNA